MHPINDDPNQKDTAHACMLDLKRIVIDNGLQNDAILVVDERIFRLCIAVSLHATGILLPVILIFQIGER